MSAIISEQHLQLLYKGYCSMPLLWEDTFFNLSQFEIPLINNEFAFAGLEVKQNIRLGKLAENLFSKWLQHNLRFDSILENLQIINGKCTIGEIDVIIFDNKFQKYIHLELVTKFYLYNPAYAASDINAWIGPNRNDSLFEKIDKLKQKQLPLLHREFTQQVLKKHGIITTTAIEQKVLFKANLFVPVNAKLNTGSFNKACIVGNYLTLNEFKKVHKTNSKYHCPTKKDWLRHPNTQCNWNSFDEVLFQINNFMEKKQSLMVWVKHKDTFMRYIVVPYEHF